MAIQFHCPNCSARLLAPDEYAGRYARCKGCNNRIQVPSEDPEIAPEVFSVPLADSSNGLDSPREQLKQLMTEEEYDILGISKMPDRVAKAIFDWSMRMYSLGQQRVGLIEDVKYEGHMIILDDGSRWEVDDSDTYLADGWTPGDRVLVIDDEMFRLDDLEKIHVQED
jgi:DNA-directed RNA polymerase subunit RPC12/RpoP